MTAVRFLGSDDVRDLATPADYVDAVRTAYRQRGTGAPARPRQAFRRETPAGLLTTYAAILPESGVMGGYVYSSGFGAGDAWFVTPLFDADSGELLAVIDGASMNPFKTGATGAVAVDELARPDASTLAVIGTGPQARGQARATATVREFSEVRVFSPTRENREAFAGEFDDRLDADVVAATSSTEAVAGADVVITATSATDPVVTSSDLADGAHVTAMGQYSPDAQELDVDTIARATYVPDLRARVTSDAGSFLAALEAGAVTEDHVHAELGEVVAGVAPGRSTDDELTVFDSGGTGIETVAAANLLYERALDRDLGSTVEFSPASESLTGR